MCICIYVYIYEIYIENIYVYIYIWNYIYMHIHTWNMFQDPSAYLKVWTVFHVFKLWITDFVDPSLPANVAQHILGDKYHAQHLSSVTNLCWKKKFYNLLLGFICWPYKSVSFLFMFQSFSSVVQYFVVAKVFKNLFIHFSRMDSRAVFYCGPQYSCL